jgi:adenine-specific DNA-methyltransferase
MTDDQRRFQELLRELFQFDCADLDFGIYRIMNYKREAVEGFITHDLPQAIAEELARGALAEASQAAYDMARAAQRIRQDWGPDALDAEGNLDQVYHHTPLGRRYLELQEKATGTRSQGALEAAIYNHLYAFFSRYYQDGDFISRRRYSKRERYAIPYNGEEVTLYWANHDQYYIKTTEHFTDYTFVSQGVTVHFKLQAADVEQDNVKGDKRFFLPCLESISWDEAATQLVIPFEVRPLTEQEAIAYGRRNQQESILAEALAQIPTQLSPKTDRPALAALSAEKRRKSDGQPITALEHHLRQYTRRNTSDFFIHKDLKGFLSRELDFYLKNEVLNLEEMEAAGEGLAGGWFQMLRLIKAVGGRIIEFLAQIEEFQKMLWEKRKFITETYYCITLGQIGEGFHPEIAACDAQWDEWKALFHIDEEEAGLTQRHKGAKRIDVLKAHPTLVLDTRHFPPDFVDRLLTSFDDLDEMTDGLLIHSENWQALNLLVEKYRREVQCVYVDPPYNTSASEILYKNEYKHSSWLSLMYDRLRSCASLLPLGAMIYITIDDFELHRLKLLLQQAYGQDSIAGCAAIRSNPSGRATPKSFSIAHEYALFVAVVGESQIGRLEHSEKQKSRYSEADSIGRYEWVNSRKHGGANAFRTARPAMYYPIFVKGSEVRIPQMSWDSAKREWALEERPERGVVVVLPIRRTASQHYEMTWKLWGYQLREGR